MVCEVSPSLHRQHQSSEPALPQGHPLDPLSAEEMRQVVQILRRQRPLSSQGRFVTIQLQEPDRPWMEAWQPGQPWDRQAFVVL